MQTCTIDTVTVGTGLPVLMGIINTSPDSFYAGSYIPSDEILPAAEEMIQNGADIIDIGGRSTAPGSVPLPDAEEKRRMITALSEVAGTGIPISVDTMVPCVFEACLSYDIHVLNDISGLTNPKLAFLASDAGFPVIAMACRNLPGDSTSFSDTVRSLQEITIRCEKAHIREYILDPGIGRWIPERTPKKDWELCRKFCELQQFNRPLLAAVSRKSFIGDLIQKTPDNRLAGSLAVTMSLLYSGAQMVRTHDVAQTRDLIRVFTEMEGLS
ncbi:MAG: dihydropteroate synthase [Methanospirillaceae archaeon]|nr:dihydropteroate synthase [Methanospirillaceae archaeon]